MRWRWVGFSVVLAVMFAGCSSSDPPGELRTPAEAQHFIAAVVHGEPATRWHLAANAEAEALRVWGEQAAIAHFGAYVRALHYAKWACELAEDSAQMGFGKFNGGDRIAVTLVARSKGAPLAQINSLLADVVRIANPDFKVLDVSLCGE